MRTTRAGLLRHRVSIQTGTPSDDGMAGQTTAWATDASVWALITPLKGEELFRAQQIQANVTHKVEMRYTGLNRLILEDGSGFILLESGGYIILEGIAGVTPKKRLLFGTRVFDIDYVANFAEQNKMLDLLVTERQV